jgi:hypothetical protein
MPRNRPGKKERAAKREHDQQALDKLNSTIASKRKNDKIDKPNGVQKPKALDSEKKFSQTELQAIVQAAVSAAVTSTTTLLLGLKPEKANPVNASTEAGNEDRPRTLADRITSPKQSLAERITFPKRK